MNAGDQHFRIAGPVEPHDCFLRWQRHARSCLPAIGRLEQYADRKLSLQRGDGFAIL